MKKYDPKAIEPKWQKIWDETKLYEVGEDDSKKAYVLDMFPYPSGVGIHLGHVRNYSISDTYGRFLRMSGHNVLRGMGWDAFGLPAENYAIKTGIAPQVSTEQNTENFRSQLQRLGYAYDWSREIDSSSQDYYKWTQYFFLLLYQRGLAYQAESMQWWCDRCKTVLANEQVVNGCCWRHEDTPVSKRLTKQWFFKITDYADRLLDDLDELDWPEKIKSMQRNWIGRSIGAEIEFQVEGDDAKITVYTTRADTLFGATYMVLAPEHPLVEKITTPEHKQSVTTYVKAAEEKSEIERMETDRKKTGRFTGAHAINPATKEKIPVWVADYVLGGYGTGAIMAVPAHDERDYEFAKEFDLPIIEVVQGASELPRTGEGTIVSSGTFDGQSSAEAREKMTAKFGKERVNYKMRDWLISRQRYWGAPIPMLHCEQCGTVPVPETDLPVVLPELKTYEPTGDGKAPLGRATDWVNATCPECDGPATRETDTMDGFACSSWYFLRFADPHNNEQPFAKDAAKYWLPVDAYVGGAEHAVMHLLYARFWTKVMQDAGMIEFGEPFKTLYNQGLILAEDGRKMSKSLGNVTDPVDLIEEGYGADALRLYELFLGPYDQSIAWNTRGIDGTKRFLNRVWALVQEHLEAEKTDGGSGSEIPRVIHKTIKKVSLDLEEFGFNTGIAAMMEAVNELYRLKNEVPLGSYEWQQNLKLLVQILAPFAPHITEELWEQLGGEGSVHVSGWPAFDERLVQDRQITVVLQVNGKVRGQIEVGADASEEEIKKMAAEHESIARYTEGKNVVKTIYVPGRLVSFVVT